MNKPIGHRRFRLSVNIITRASEDRLARLVSEVREFADEVLIGVDVASTDGTYDEACRLADVVYRFRLPGQLSPARMLVFQYATGDWILSLDDDESIEKGFDESLAGMIAGDDVTHVWFPRKWITSLDPCEYACAAPWFPNWCLRLFRNDRSLVWKPNYVHSQYRVQGIGLYQEQVSILHFEQVVISAQIRKTKLEMYRRADGPSAEEYYAIPHDVQKKPATLRPLAPAAAPGKGLIHASVHDLQLVGLPPWKAEFLNVDLAARVAPNQSLMAIVTVRNVGGLAWTRPAFTNQDWPVLGLGCHLLDDDCRMLKFEQGRAPIHRTVRIGEEITLFVQMNAPRETGNYILEWDMVSDKECWFAACGSGVVRTSLAVTGEAAKG